MYLLNGKEFLGSLLVLSILLTWSVLRENGGFLHLHFCDSFPFAYNQLNHILNRGHHLQGPICFTKTKIEWTSHTRTCWQSLKLSAVSSYQQKPFILSITRYSYKNYPDMESVVFLSWGGGGRGGWGFKRFLVYRSRMVNLKLANVLILVCCTLGFPLRPISALIVFN